MIYLRNIFNDERFVLATIDQKIKDNFFMNSNENKIFFKNIIFLFVSTTKRCIKELDGLLFVSIEFALSPKMANLSFLALLLLLSFANRIGNRNSLLYINNIER